MIKRMCYSATANNSLATKWMMVVVVSQGVKFLRRLKQLLNPAQVFDLMAPNGGPLLGLQLFSSFQTFRILVCGGDGSVSWVLSEIDRLRLHKQCQIGEDFRLPPFPRFPHFSLLIFLFFIIFLLPLFPTPVFSHFLLALSLEYASARLSTNEEHCRASPRK